MDPGVNTIASFDARIDAFKRIYVPDQAAIDNQRSYLLRVRKTDKFTVPKFLDRLKQINLLIAQFPGATTTHSFTDAELKRIFYLSMPTRWRTNFINSGQTLHSSTIESLKIYMIHQEQQTGNHWLKKAKDKNKGGNVSRNNNNNAESTQGGNQSRNKRRQQRQAGPNSKKRIDNDAPCPLHGDSHTWGQCHQNQYGENFRPRRDVQSSNTNTVRQQAPRPTSRQTYRPPQGQYLSHQSTRDSRSIDEHSDTVDTNQHPPATRQFNDSQRGGYYLNEVHQVSDNQKEELDYSPEGYVYLDKMNGNDTHLHCLGLFDSGSTTTLLNKRAIPRSVEPMLGHPQEFTTTQGSYRSDGIISITKLTFPQFCKSREIPNVVARVFDSPTSQYDIILGRDVLSYGFVLDHGTKQIIWDGLSIPMVSPKQSRTSNGRSMYVCTHYQCAASARSSYAAESRKILDAKYDPVSPDDVIAVCPLLNEQNKLQLKTLITKFRNLFSGKLGRYKKKAFTIQVRDPATKPIFCKPYQVPQVHLQVFKKELDHLVQEHVLQRVQTSEWAFPTFIIPKKDGRVRLVSDFRRLNKLLRKSKYFLPSIPTIMQRRAGFTLITKIDISMGFYTFALTLASQALCVIIIPFGLYK